MRKRGDGEEGRRTEGEGTGGGERKKGEGEDKKVEGGGLEGGRGRGDGCHCDSSRQQHKYTHIHICTCTHIHLPVHTQHTYTPHSEKSSHVALPHPHSVAPCPPPESTCERPACSWSTHTGPGSCECQRSREGLYTCAGTVSPQHDPEREGNALDETESMNKHVLHQSVSWLTIFTVLSQVWDTIKG